MNDKKKTYIPIPEDTRYLWCPEDQRVYSTKVAGVSLYPMKIYEDYYDRQNHKISRVPHSQLNKDGERIIVTLEYLNTLKGSDMTFKYTGKFVVGSITKQGGEFSVATYPAPHDTEPKAKAEAERLAKIHREKKFVVLKVEGIVSTNDVVWE